MESLQIIIKCLNEINQSEIVYVQIITGVQLQLKSPDEVSF